MTAISRSHPLSCHSEDLVPTLFVQSSPSPRLPRPERRSWHRRTSPLEHVEPSPSDSPHSCLRRDAAENQLAFSARTHQELLLQGWPRFGQSERTNLAIPLPSQ